MRSPLVKPSFGKNTLPRLETSRVTPRPMVRVPLPPCSSRRSSCATTLRAVAEEPDLRAVLPPDAAFLDAALRVPFEAGALAALFRAAARARLGASPEERRTAS